MSVSIMCLPSTISLKIGRFSFIHYPEAMNGTVVDTRDGGQRGRQSNYLKNHHLSAFVYCLLSSPRKRKRDKKALEKEYARETIDGGHLSILPHPQGARP